jgi:hypothetical protein
MDYLARIFFPASLTDFPILRATRAAYNSRLELGFYWFPAEKMFNR